MSAHDQISKNLKHRFVVDGVFRAELNELSPAKATPADVTLVRTENIMRTTPPRSPW
jgi:hypothetical protein